MKITFYLPAVKRGPVGGYKVVYKYAEFLAERGNNVVIIHDNRKLTGRKWIDWCLPARLVLMALLYGFRPRWYDIDQKVKQISIITDFDLAKIPDADVIIATAAITADNVNNLSSTKGKKHYFIQDLENWELSDEELFATYNMPFRIITIADWLKKEIEKHTDNQITVIKNGIELDAFYVDNIISNRNPYAISMLYHKMPHKGSRYGIEALKILHEEYPQTTCKMFGTMKRPGNLPKWINYTQQASRIELNKIYNSSAIFLCPTIQEGFGLTGAESMACGCALVSTEYDGVKEYAVNGKNAVLCEVKNPQSLYEGMRKLIVDQKLRISIAEQGNLDIQLLSWENAINKFERLLNGEK